MFKAFQYVFMLIWLIILCCTIIARIGQLTLSLPSSKGESFCCKKVAQPGYMAFIGIHTLQFLDEHWGSLSHFFKPKKVLRSVTNQHVYNMGSILNAPLNGALMCLCSAFILTILLFQLLWFTYCSFLLYLLNLYVRCCLLVSIRVYLKCLSDT